MRRCPRFDECSVPFCPLDILNHEVVRLPDEPACTLPKSIRMRLGFDIPSQGLLPKELAGLNSWLKKTDEERVGSASRIASLGASFRFAPRSQNRQEEND